jgi:hypothetical protein
VLYERRDALLDRAIANTAGMAKLGGMGGNRSAAATGGAYSVDNAGLVETRWPEMCFDQAT